jgi:hypothetical protein
LRMTGAVRRLTAVVIAVAMVAAMVFLTSDPAKTAIRTRVSFNVDDKTVKPNEKVLFFGKVKSKKNKCKKNRKVVLKRKGTGKIRSKRSDGEGEFSFRHNPNPDHGRFYVVVKKKRIKTGGGGGGGYGYGYGYGYGAKKKKCKKAVSRTIRIRPAP